MFCKEELHLISVEQFFKSMERIIKAQVDDSLLMEGMDELQANASVFYQ